ncbi:MAG: M48 family metalloprotease [Bacilli bacterium]|nr:M48 family metalloprotease [Bacilli bacterium]
MKRNLLGISLITITGLYVLLSAIIILATIICDIPVIYGIGVSIVILIIQFLISPFLTDLSMKWFYKVKWDYEIPDYLKDFIKKVCEENKMKLPRIGFIDDGAPNAFSYGHTKNDARVVITRGILELLTEEEVKGVVAHELGHASHYDMLFMTVAQLVPLIMYGIYEILKDVKSDSDDNNYTQLIAIIAYVLYVISNYIVLWLSRTREYYADYFSIEETKNPNALASALVKIGYGLTTSSSNSKHSASKPNALGIFDSKASKSLIVTTMEENKEISKDHIKQAMKWEQWNIWAKLYELNSTHPLISKRLLAISSYSKDYNQEPYIVFDLKKEESYLDDFIVECIISFLPGLFFLIGVILVLIGTDSNWNTLLIGGVAGFLTMVASLIKYFRKYKKGEFKNTTVRDLLGEVKVSHITSIPCTLEGNIIGRGNPGCIFNEDFVIKDKTGIIFLDYNQPLMILNKIFALFKSKEYFDKTVKVTGWYRRSPVPYVELLTLEVDGKVKKIHTYKIGLAVHMILLITSIVVIGLSLF